MAYYSSTLYWPRVDEGCEWSWGAFIFCAIPKVDILRTMYQFWICLTPAEQRKTKLLVTRRITNRDLLGERTFRIIEAIIGAFDEWTNWQNEKGACGFSPDLTIITDYFETDISIAIATLEKFLSRGTSNSPILPMAVGAEGGASKIGAVGAGNKIGTEGAGNKIPVTITFGPSTASYKVKQRTNEIKAFDSTSLPVPPKMFTEVPISIDEMTDKMSKICITAGGDAPAEEENLTSQSFPSDTSDLNIDEI